MIKVLWRVQRQLWYVWHINLGMSPGKKTHEDAVSKSDYHINFLTSFIHHTGLLELFPCCWGNIINFIYFLFYKKINYIWWNYSCNICWGGKYIHYYYALYIHNIMLYYINWPFEGHFFRLCLNEHVYNTLVVW